MSSNVFIADGVEIVGDCSIGAESVVFPQVRIKAINEANVILGERNVIEEKALVEDSMLGHANVLSVGCSVVRCKLGSFNMVGLGSQLEDCTLGNLCVVAAGARLKGVELADNTVVFLSPRGEIGNSDNSGDGGGGGRGWSASVTAPEALRLQHEANQAYYTAVSSPTSPQFIGRHIALRS